MGAPLRDTRSSTRKKTDHDPPPVHCVGAVGGMGGPDRPTENTTMIHLIIDSADYEAICNAIRCVQEQLEVLNEGMSNQWNVDGYIDQQGIDDAIICKERTLMHLEGIRERLDEQFN